MQNLIKTVLILFLFCFLTQCSSIGKNLYPIHSKNNLKVTDKITEEKYSTDYNSNNFYQLRVKELEVFLPIKINTEKGEKEVSLVSNVAFKKFEQHNSPQRAKSETDTLTVEETYIYLDNFNNNNAQTHHGYTFFFVTFPTMDEVKKDINSRTRKYFNNSDLLYANIFRSVQIGYWIKNSQNKIMMMFKNSENEIVVYESIMENNILKIESVSHPSKIIYNNDSIDDFLFINEYLNTSKEIVGEPLSMTQGKVDNLYNAIKGKVNFIQLNNVFDLNDDKAMLFFQVPETKKFIIETKDLETKTLNAIKFTIGHHPRRKISFRKRNYRRTRFYISFNDKDDIVHYIFKRKNTSAFIKYLYK